MSLILQECADRYSAVFNLSGIKNITKYLLLLLTVIMNLSCSKEIVKPIWVNKNFSGALWVVRSNISTPRKVDEIVNTVDDTGIKHIFVQVRGRGDAYYDSDIEPLASDVPRGFDPLKYLIEKTRNTDIRIHAWVNINYLLDLKSYPPKSGHILSKHPEWITCDYTGRSIADYSEKELEDNMVEGLFVDPAIPEVRKYIISVIEDILSRYSVDGIHMDFIRYPYSGYHMKSGKYLSDFGYNPVAREIFKNKYGIDPITIDRFARSPQKKLFDDFRREQVTEIVKMVNSAVKRKSRELVVSAAVMPTLRATEVYFQDWPDWLKNDLIDIACVMSYTDDPDIYKKYLDFASGSECSRQIFMGVRIRDDSSISNVYREVKMAYDSNMRGYIIFSFKYDKDFIEDLDRLVKYNRSVFRY